MGRLTLPHTLIADIARVAETLQPELKLSVGDVLRLEGPYIVSGPEGPFDQYNVQINVLAGFPHREPVVFETGGRIPRIADRHVFPESGQCCLGVWEEWLLKSDSHTFSDFIMGPLNDYFTGQSYFEIHGEWPFGERSHGYPGIIESYADILGLEQDLKVLESYLRLLSRPAVKGHYVCPCGSGRIIRKCHGSQIFDLRERIPHKMAALMLRKAFPAGPVYS